MPFDSSIVHVSSAGSAMWKVDEPLVYRGRYDTFVIPDGFLTDFATIPPILTWLVGRTGSHTRAVILHDWLVTAGIESGEVSHRDADAILRRVLRETGTPFVQRWLMWAGVRFGSLAGGRRRGWIRDAPLVALITLLAAPMILPPAAVAGVAYVVYRVAEEVAWLWGAMFKRPRPDGENAW